MPQKVQKGGAKKAPTKKQTKKVTKKSVKKVVKKPVTKKTSSLKGGSKVPTSRYFKVVLNEGEAFGRFSGSKPKQAANKALTSILRKKRHEKKSTKGKIHFSIVECTRGSKRKEYNYVGNRVKLDDPVTVNIKGKEVTYQYSNVVRKDKAAQSGGAKKPAQKGGVKKASKKPVKKASKKPKKASKNPVKKASKKPVKKASKKSVKKKSKNE